MAKTTYRDDTIRNVMMLAAMFLIGLVMLVFPNETDLALLIICGATLIGYGAVQIVSYVRKKENVAPFSPGSLSTGLTLLFLGAFILMNRAVMNSILNKVLGFVLIFAGFSSLQTALSLKKLKADKWYFSLIIAVLSVVSGVIAILASFEASVLMIFMGIAFCVESVLLAVNLILFYRLMRHDAAPTPKPAADQPPASPTPNA